MMTPEERLLVAIYSEKVFKGNIIRQEKPVCCRQEIDLLKTDVRFKEISIGKEQFLLLEPICPICLERIEASYALIH